MRRLYPLCLLCVGTSQHAKIFAQARVLQSVDFSLTLVERASACHSPLYLQLQCSVGPVGQPIVAAAGFQSAPVHREPRSFWSRELAMIPASTNR